MAVINVCCGPFTLVPSADLKHLFKEAWHLEGPRKSSLPFWIGSVQAQAVAFGRQKLLECPKARPSSRTGPPSRFPCSASSVGGVRDWSQSTRRRRWPTDTSASASTGSPMSRTKSTGRCGRCAWDQRPEAVATMHRWAAARNGISDGGVALGREGHPVWV